MPRPENIRGVWNGSYFYDREVQQLPDGAGVGFELYLSQAWWQSLPGWFSGFVTDDPERGMPGTGRISGRLRGSAISFTKWMPISHVNSEGQSGSLRDLLSARGLDPGYDVPHRPVYYRGTFSTADSASGTWRITAGRFHVNARLSLRLAETTGTWTLVHLQ